MTKNRGHLSSVIRYIKTKEIIEIQSAIGAVRLLVIPTDEELEIAEQTVECIKTLKPVNKFLY